MTSRSSSLDAVVAEVEARAGAGLARPGVAADAIDGIVPGIVAQPPTPAALATTLAWATETGRMLSDVSKASADGGGTTRDPADPTGLRL